MKSQDVFSSSAVGRGFDLEDPAFPLRSRRGDRLRAQSVCRVQASEEILHFFFLELTSVNSFSRILLEIVYAILILFFIS